MAKGKIIQWDGNVIREPGIYKGIPLDLYHSKELFGGLPAISSSGLRTIFLRSAAHYWVDSPYNPDRIEDEDAETNKKNLMLGRALHHLVGAEKGFKEQFIIRPMLLPDKGESIAKPWQGNRTACKEWLAMQKEHGLAVISPDQAEQLKGMALSLGRHPLVHLLSGQIEHSYIWRDKRTGILLKWRPDTTPTDSADFVDLKGTTDVRFYKLMKTVADFGYHQQGALGRWACHELLGREMASFSLFFIEWKPPYSCALMQLRETDLKLGEQMNRIALDTFWQCWTEKKWPGPEDTGWIGIPDKDREQTEARIRAANPAGEAA